METINGYTPLRPFSSVGAGTASWTIARKYEREYFLKRFNSPKYVPSCMEFCKVYEAKKQALYDALRAIDNGNLVLIEDFFHYDTFYYIATEKIDESSITAKDAHSLPMDKLFIVIKTLVHCMMQLENKGIVHADLKPANVMLKPTRGGFYALKLIDFDSSFFEADPPSNKEDLEGDMVYLSPEVLMNMCGEDVALTCKIDVFAAGIMLHQFLAGITPEFDSDYDSVCEAVANGGDVRISHTIPQPLRELIASMLRLNAEDRPTFSEVFRQLCAYESTDEYKSAFGKKDTIIVSEAVPKSEAKPSAGKNPWMRKAGNL